MKKIRCKIDKKGNVIIEVDGVQGQSCQEITRPFLEAIGTTQEVTLKEEFYSAEENQEVKVGQ